MVDRRDEHRDFELLSRFFDGTCSSAEVQEIEARRESEPEFTALFDSLEKLWGMKPDTATEVPEFNVDKAWANVDERISTPTIQKKTKSKRPWIGVAAGVALLIGFFLFKPNQPVYQNQILAQAEVITDTLPDASIITLNKESKIQVSYKKGQRNIDLNGEAFFDVARDEKRPFVISSGEIQVAVLGTSFNVKALQGDSLVEVWVKSGKVKFYGTYQGSDSLVLTAGQKGIFNKNKRTFRKLEDSNLNAVAWKTKRLIFSNTRLGEVIPLLEQVYGAKIKLAKADHQDCQINADFEDETLETVLAVIGETLHLRVEERGDTFVFVGDGCQ
ncbi:FecR domain-containing protein [bacterium SCSIO 12741]|nr:FecR domain-containing protein [bacterium SCSIO 12741]